MKKVLILLLALVLSAHTCNHIPKEIIERTMISYDDTLNGSGLDSLFIADSLSFNIEEDWISSSAVSEEERDFIYKYAFIKELTDSTGIIYTLCSYQDTLYIINKRVIE